MAIRHRIDRLEKQTAGAQGYVKTWSDETVGETLQWVAEYLSLEPINEQDGAMINPPSHL